MMKLNVWISSLILFVISSVSMASEFSFDRPGTGFGTGITPVGNVAWEQGLPTVSYTRSFENGVTNSTTTLNADVLVRTGLAKNLELQLGWNGPSWQRTKVAQTKTDVDGLGDVSIGVKKAIDLNDDRLAWAILAQANLATGNDEFTADNDSYSLGSTLEYAQDDVVSTALTLVYAYEDGQNWTFSAIPTLNYQFTPKLAGFSEFVYSKTESQNSEKSLGTGLIYAVNDRMQLDASIGIALNSDDRQYTGGLGVAFLF